MYLHIVIVNKSEGKSTCFLECSRLDKKLTTCLMIQYLIYITNQTSMTHIDRVYNNNNPRMPQIKFISYSLAYYVYAQTFFA